jgi:hypothetical protein
VLRHLVIQAPSGVRSRAQAEAKVAIAREHRQFGHAIGISAGAVLSTEQSLAIRVGVGTGRRLAVFRLRGSRLGCSGTPSRVTSYLRLLFAIVCILSAV